MRFLFVSRYKDSFFALPPEKSAAIGAAAMAFVEKYLKSGKCKEAYMQGNGRGTVSIWDFASAEEMARLVREYPMYPFIEQESIPLVESDAAVKMIKERVEAAKKAT